MNTRHPFALAVEDPAVLAKAAALLASKWDPQAEFPAPDGSRNAEAHAAAVIGMLAGGPDTARVAGYLRWCEEQAIGTARSDRTLRWELANDIWAMLVDAAAAAYVARGKAPDAR